MIKTSHRLRSSLEGALAGGGDPASSPLYVFGPFLQFITLAGAAEIVFGVSVWLVVITVAVVALMYRQVIRWVTDGTGGSGLTEEEFGSWAVKVNSAITFVEYTLTFLVSIAALVTLLADRYPAIDHGYHGFNYRVVCGVVLSLGIGWLVNRGPKMAARAFGPATFGVLLLLWVMIIATIWKLGFHLPNFDFHAFSGRYTNITLSGYSKLLALMTGIEVFANLVSAYEGKPEQRSKMAFQSLLIAMGTTCLTMLIVGPAILKIANSADGQLSVFTQAMDYLLPEPLPYIGTLIGIVVLASAAAASAQGLQNLALGLRFRHYVPARMGQRNRFDVADLPVWFEVSIVCVCFIVLGTREETYLTLYAVGVFILLSMTGWASVKRSYRLQKGHLTLQGVLVLLGSMVAALLTTGATLIIFRERFSDGAWAYFLLIPVIYLWFTYVRIRLGVPVPLSDHIGRLHAGTYLASGGPNGIANPFFQHILVPLNGTPKAEAALALAEVIATAFQARLTLLTAASRSANRIGAEGATTADSEREYLQVLLTRLRGSGIEADSVIEVGEPPRVIAEKARDMMSDLIVMSAHGKSTLEQLFLSDVVERTIRQTISPFLLFRPQPAGSREPAFARLMIALDGSQSAEATLPYARSLAATFASELLLLAVPESDSEQSQLDEYLRNIANGLAGEGFRARAITMGSGPARTIQMLSVEERIDVVLMARSGRGEAHRYVALGSVANRILQTVQCAVLLIDSKQSVQTENRVVPRRPQAVEKAQRARPRAGAALLVPHTIEALPRKN